VGGSRAHTDTLCSFTAVVLAWSAQDWADLIGVGASSLRDSWPGQVGSSARPYLLVYAYLVTGFTAFDRVGRFHCRSLAWRVFGREPVDDAIGQMSDVLTGWGYHRRCGQRELTAVVGLRSERCFRPDTPG
jgi:hypothetical protein